MAHPVCEVLLTEKALGFVPLSGESEAGAVVDFWGVVRGWEDGAEITGIDYEAHRIMAEHQLRAVAEATREKFDLPRVLLHHRVGFVPVGEASLLVRLTSGHRAEAFAAGKWLVDELKKRVPIWKHPRFKNAADETGSALGDKEVLSQ